MAKSTLKLMEYTKLKRDVKDGVPVDKIAAKYNLDHKAAKKFFDGAKKELEQGKGAPIKVTAAKTVNLVSEGGPSEDAYQPEPSDGEIY